ncbi:hypothetical protein Anas_12670 [Armadillidium nasatum]|uniref:Fe2OG dioxygenase domain-containing protein n=1 Tax=Armadillidium nasatum TaxID=96803 RepID=A0A5N5SK68_9CRUS|nr:hypothetical protein Anas_12670 [Armadillidium nasatum]
MINTFFNLPFEIKKSYARKDAYSAGYVEPSKEILKQSDNVKELRESFDIIGNFDGFIPNEIEKFERSLLKMIEMGSDFFSKFLRCLEIGLNLPFGTLQDMHAKIYSDSNMSTLRLIHYPPIPFEIPENCVRCGEHTDYGTITILFQDNMGGLEVKNRNNEWVQAHPVPGALLVNVGDMLQKFTSGRLRATPHRVLIPEEERRKRCPRKSVVFFLVPDNDVILKPFEEPKDETKSYETSHDYLYSRLISTFNF